MTFSLSGSIITQSGTDTDISGLGGITGVTTTTVGDRNYYNLGTLKLLITGTLTHDPDAECILTTVTGTGNPAIEVSTGTYNFGIETTSGAKTRYSSGVGIVCQGGDTNNNAEWQQQNYSCIYLSASTATWVGRGGVILSDRGFGIYNGPTLDVIDTRLTKYGTTARREIRFDSDSAAPSGTFAAIVDGFQMSTRRLPATFSPVMQDAEVVQLANTFHSSDIAISNIDISNNVASNTDLGTDELNGGPNFYRLTNCSDGSAIRTMPKSGVGNSRQLGGLILQKEVSFNFVDGDTASNIQGVELYMIDTDNGYRKNANSQNHLADKVYTGTSDVNGDIAALTIITAITNIDTEGAFSYSDWDTTLYTNRYKVDRRGLDDTTNDNFLFKFASYNHGLSQNIVSCKGLNELNVAWTLFGDSLITQSTKATVEAYTAIETAQKWYDYDKSNLIDNYDGETQTYTSREADTVLAGSANITLQSGTNSDPIQQTLSGGVVTDETVYIGTDFTGTINTTGSVTDTRAPTTINYSVTNDLVLQSAAAEWTLDGVSVGNIVPLAGQNLVVNLINGATASTTNAGTSAGQVNIIQSVTMTIQGQIVGGVLVVYDNDSADPQDLGTELARFNTATATETYVYSASKVPDSVTIVMLATGYKQIVRDVDLQSSSFAVILEPELETN